MLSHFLKNVGWTPLLEVKEEVYEDLVRVFYANMKVLK